MFRHMKRTEEEPIIRIGNDTPAVIVVDDFYSDPDAVREYALSQNYQKPGEHGAVGHRCEEGRKLFEGTREAFEKLLSGKLKEGDEEGGWNYSTNGCFQWCPAGTRLVYHHDSQQWAGSVYLTPNAPPEAGTSFYIHKQLGLDKMPKDPPDWWTLHSQMYKNNSDEPNFLDRTPWEEIDRVGNKYNRLVLWDAQRVHSASQYFGDQIHNSRLFHLFFFNLDTDPVHDSSPPVGRRRHRGYDE